MEFKSGFVAIIGEPNVGKSSLLNSILHTKVSIVSPKPQTTRNKIVGIYNEPGYQIVFIDTPGYHVSKNRLDEFMTKNINAAKEGVDVIVLIIDGTKHITDDNLKFITTYDSSKVIVAVNKIDGTSFEKLYPELDKLNSLKNVSDIIPISAKTGQNVNVLLQAIKNRLGEGVKYFEEDIYTDKSTRFIASEVIREKALWCLQDEVPHGIAVDITEFNEGETLDTISADIICEKESHKPIIIGANGSMLKKIGTLARIDLEKIVDKKIMLKLFVKVKEDWRNNKSYVDSLGYGNDNI